MGYSYDAAGNMTSDGNHTYAYDAENRIVAVDGGAATYLYDALGRRTSKRIGTAFTDYAYDLAGSPVIEVKNSCGGQTCWATGYVYLNGQMVAEYRDATVYFVLGDHLGSTRLLTKVDQTVLDSMDYLPYGEQIAGDTGGTHKFTGKERDSESGLDEFGARYFSSSLGRFMIPDWAATATSVPYADFGDPQSLNLYGYMKNSPMSGADPDGHCPDICDLADPKFGSYTQEDLDRKADAVTTVLSNPYFQGGALLVSAYLTGGATLELAEVAGPADAGTLLTGAMSSSGAGVAGSTQILGAATNTDTTQALSAVNAVSSPAGLAATIITAGATGNPSRALSVGSAASTVSAAGAAVKSPSEAAKDPVGTALTFGDLVKTIHGAASGLASYFRTPPPPPPPAAPQPPTSSSAPAKGGAAPTGDATFSNTKGPAPERH